MLACLMPMLAGLLPACNWHNGASAHTVGVIKVGAAQYSGGLEDPLHEACRKWTLTPAQVERFFAISKTYSETPYSEFYQLPCAISGELSVEGRTWAFEINGGGTATWTGDGEVRHWGCSAEACETLLLLPTDGMKGG